MKIIITGAAGFIGTNLAISLMNEHELVLIDNFSRVGATANNSLLMGLGLKNYKIDIRQQLDLYGFLDGLNNFDFLIHLAAQTSLLESIRNPKIDFDTNALGTLNLLEYLRTRNPTCRGIFLASNKVYGSLSQFNYIETPTRFQLADSKIDFDESLPLLPVGGYSISKNISDTYVIEYGQRYNLPVISLRQSAVYGRNQNPRSDQGWVSYFVDEFKRDNKVQLHGNGKQVRDILYIDDFCVLIKNLLKVQFKNGEVYNVGGGFNNSLSILELFKVLESLTGKLVAYELGNLSKEDQKYFVSNNKKISALTNWKPTISPEFGITELLRNNRSN